MPDWPEIPPEWLGRIPELTGACKLEVAGFATAVDLTREQLAGVYLPLLAFLTERTNTCSRVVAGLAGIPGGGKSTFAAALAHVAERLTGPGWLGVVPMDGWHWPNAVLDARTISDEAGQSVPLRTRKGGPHSFDTDALIAALKRLRSEEMRISLPAYDRRLHEPVPDAISISPKTKVVLVEGNYLLGGIAGQPEWDMVAELLAPKLYLACDPETARERIIARHIRGGTDREAAIRKYEANDRKNIEAVLASANRANTQITVSPPGLMLLP